MPYEPSYHHFDPNPLLHWALHGHICIKVAMELINGFNYAKGHAKPNVSRLHIVHCLHLGAHTVSYHTYEAVELGLLREFLV